MNKISDEKALIAGIEGYLDTFPGDLICARQIWYEGLDGCGIPTEADMEAMHRVLCGQSNWESVGLQRFEKFDMQYSYKRKK